VGTAGTGGETAAEEVEGRAERWGSGERGKVVGRFGVLTVIKRKGRIRSLVIREPWKEVPAMIELTVRLTDEQLAEIAQRAAALVSSTPAASPWLNVTDAAERLRCGKDRIYDLIALGKLQPRRDGRRVLLHRDDLDAYIEGRDR
jgi:excisionase family DNA binding protein